MSLAKITTVQTSRNDLTCGKCRTELPKGSAYRWFKVGFRSRVKNVRCMNAKCSPTMSERESSKIAAIYAAYEDFESGNYDTVDDIEEALQEVASVIREVAEEYQEASEDENGNVFNTLAEERAELLEAAADEVESITVEAEEQDCPVCDGGAAIEEMREKDPTDGYECEECGGENVIYNMDGVLEEVVSQLNDIELP